MKKSISDWINACHGLSMEKGWYEGQLGIHANKQGSRLILNERFVPEKLCLIHSEVSEALECYRNSEMRTNVGSHGKPEGFPAELADVVIRCFDLAGAMGIDLEKEIEQKHEFNKTRPYRHGGKTA